MNRFTAEAFKPLDEEEEALMDSLDNETWQPVANVEEEVEKAVLAARRSIKKDRRINLRLTEKDYYEIQIRAIEEGVPYQTLVASIIHKYLNGSLTAQE